MRTLSARNIVFGSSASQCRGHECLDREKIDLTAEQVSYYVAGRSLALQRPFFHREWRTCMPPTCKVASQVLLKELAYLCHLCLVLSLFCQRQWGRCKAMHDVTELCSSSLEGPSYSLCRGGPQLLCGRSSGGCVHDVIACSIGSCRLARKRKKCGCEWGLMVTRWMLLFPL